MSYLDQNINYLAILVSSYKGVGFYNIETATVTLFQDEAKVAEIFLGAVKSNKNNTVLAAIIYKKEGQWHIYNSQSQSPGKVFTECQQIIKWNLSRVGFDPDILQKSKTWTSK